MNLDLTVTLTAEDAFQAVSVATVQMLRKMAKDRPNGHGGPSVRGMRERWADSIHGAMGELALSHILHKEWTPGGMSITKGDVANRLEVRATEHKTGHLLIYRNDPDEAFYALMIGHYPVFRLAGGMFGDLAKRDQWWRPNADPPCWWIPQADLFDIADVEGVVR
jgi:hypothetical protein